MAGMLSLFMLEGEYGKKARSMAFKNRRLW